MVNEKGKRELVYPAQITDIKPIAGYDKVEQAFVGGWSILVKKNQFYVGDWGIFFEIDSKVPEVPPFEFLEKRHYKIKTIKMCGILSQGLLMSFDDFNGTDFQTAIDTLRDAERKGKDLSKIWLTNLLGVKYATPEDNKRKENLESSYIAASQKHPKIAKSWIVKKLKKYMWFRKLFAKFFNTKKKGRNFPNHFPYVKPTDEERIENLMSQIDQIRKIKWIATEKLDGTSSTYILERKGRKKFEFYVCSRNVRQLSPTQSNYHNQQGIEDNVYWTIAKKYKIEDVLKDFLIKNPKLSYAALQGETVGPKLQGNPLQLDELDFYGFNFITSDSGRWDTIKAKELLEEYNIKWVPIIATDVEIPSTIEEIKKIAEGRTLVGEGRVLREGVVYRSSTDGKYSFKNVANSYLLSKKN